MNETKCIKCNKDISDTWKCIPSSFIEYIYKGEGERFKMEEKPYYCLGCNNELWDFVIKDTSLRNENKKLQEQIKVLESHNLKTYPQNNPPSKTTIVLFIISLILLYFGCFCFFSLIDMLL